MADTKRRRARKGWTEKSFAVIFAVLLAIWSIREAIYAIGARNRDERVEAIFLCLLFALISYGVWQTFKSRNST